MHYSNHPPQEYTIVYQGKQTGIGKTAMEYGGEAVWNLFWLSDPNVESAWGQPYQYDADLLLACVKDVNATVGGFRLGDQLTKLDPIELITWMWKLPVDHLECVKLQGHYWLMNLKLRAHHWKLDSKSKQTEGNVTFADFKGRYKSVQPEVLERA